MPTDLRRNNKGVACGDGSHPPAPEARRRREAGSGLLLRLKKQEAEVPMMLRSAACLLEAALLWI